MEESASHETSRARRIRLLRQFSKVARSSLGTGLMGTLFTYPAVLVEDLQTHGTSLYGTPLNIDGMQDLIGSLLMLSSLPGAWLTGALAMRLGRRKGMMMNGTFAFIGWLAMALIPHAAGILLSRCISGVAVGGMTVIVNSYVAELADADVRGIMCMCLSLAILAGQILSVVLGYCVRYFTAAFINALVPAAFILFLFWLPESPSYLVVTGKEDKAVEVLLDLRGHHADVKQEISSYKDFNKQQEGSTGSWRTLAQPDVLKSLLVVSGLFFLVAFTGFLAVNSYSVQVFEAAGSSVDSGLASIILMVLQFAGGIVSVFLIDGIGRKNTLFLCFSLMAVGLGLMSAYCGVLESGSTTTTIITATTTATTTATVSATPPAVVGIEGWGWAPLAFLGLSQTAMFMGLNLMPFLLNQEYFPTAIRAQACSICFTMWTLSTFTTLQFYTPMVTVMTQAGLYGFYCFFCVIGIPFTFFFIRETAGKAVG
ncbi:facilitated trehalose transporter Tret1-like [Portunus trituberculatus]|uniref:facilitated trehalose transporter Tret1-like n=1 Tax=Portunus trituberculatus TaxID=210409 RepID=UPI001E1CFCF3|nr:facilitated trehalose transporter Tret1-like [Portunus trituberculatus]XP_045123790.1 facilitated trehalose transporter Tret1-like [Portunus trituberculatus]XP_045123798.1 facilitated trehalose transporter Tret1-like [Portunus trituberculatus]XP_045123806.1 facilitated trehalose transporter Tret1-like [Portunus trituberculatus]XP_045123811.1 facilitated trehalose transporter Tret1-like [Portunus trituberculatus]XP_045123816.1 facilitated trehalose transporter Tret1-like [Portunus tritubercu